MNDIRSYFDSYSDPSPPAQRPAVSFRCPYCKSHEIPAIEKTTSAIGWILGLLLLPTLVFWWIPLVFMKDEHRRCRTCGMRLG
jgi:LITAF-like zinc ribbon domain